MHLQYYCQLSIYFLSMLIPHFVTLYYSWFCLQFHFAPLSHVLYFRNYIILITVISGLTMEVFMLKGNDSLFNLIDQYLAVYPTLVSPPMGDSVYGGYVTIILDISFVLTAVFNGTISDAQAAIEPFTSYLYANPQMYVVKNCTFYAASSMNAWHNSVQTYRPDTGASPFTTRFCTFHVVKHNIIRSQLCNLCCMQVSRLLWEVVWFRCQV